MDTKYQTAYCDTMDTFVSSSDVKKIKTEKVDFYYHNILGHLWCPDCKKVMLSLVRIKKGDIFRGYPKQVHENCVYSFPVCQTCSVKELIKEEGNLEDIQKQLKRLLGYTFAAIKASKVNTAAAAPIISASVPKLPRHKLQTARLPEKRIDLPLTEDDYAVTKVFYGKVRLTSTCGRKYPDRHYFTLFRIDSKEKICTISVNANVWQFLCQNPLLQDGRRIVRISFCGEIVKNPSRGDLFCTLHRSQLLEVLPE